MNEEQITKKKNIVLPIVIGIAALALIGCIVAVLIVYSSVAKPKKELQKQLEMGEKYLADLEYDNAILAYEAALTIDPKNVVAYTGIINAYSQSGNLEEALAAVQRAYDATGDEQFRQIAEELKATVAEKEPSAPEEPGEIPAGSGNPYDKNITVSNISFQFLESEGSYNYKGEQRNALGQMLISFYYIAPEPVEFLTVDWQENAPFDDGQLAELLSPYGNSYVALNAINASGMANNSFPVFPEYPGKTFYVLLLARGEGGKVVGYTQVPVTVEIN